MYILDCPYFKIKRMTPFYNLFMECPLYVRGSGECSQNESLHGLMTSIMNDKCHEP